MIVFLPLASFSANLLGPYRLRRPDEGENSARDHTKPSLDADNSISDTIGWNDGDIYLLRETLPIYIRIKPLASDLYQLGPLAHDTTQTPGEGIAECGWESNYITRL